MRKYARKPRRGGRISPAQIAQAVKRAYAKAKSIGPVRKSAQIGRLLTPYLPPQIQPVTTSGVQFLDEVSKVTGLGRKKAVYRGRRRGGRSLRRPLPHSGSVVMLQPVRAVGGRKRKSVKRRGGSVLGTIKRIVGAVPAAAKAAAMKGLQAADAYRKFLTTYKPVTKSSQIAGALSAPARLLPVVGTPLSSALAIGSDIGTEIGRITGTGRRKPRARRGGKKAPVKRAPRRGAQKPMSRRPVRRGGQTIYVPRVKRVIKL